MFREVKQTKFALGGEVTLAFVTDMDNLQVERLFNALWHQTYVFEKRFSRFLPKSELTIFNRLGGVIHPISPEFRSLLVKSKQLSIETGGLFNPFIMPALQRAGYINSTAPGHENDIQTDYTNRQVVGIENLTITDNGASIPYATAIDFGGCGKGYLADQLGETLRGRNVRGYWLLLSGDVVTMGCDENDKTMSLNIQSANDLEKTSTWRVDCPPRHFATATSGTFRRAGQDTGRDWHHIIDPTTLAPAKTDVRLATVCAEEGIKADVLASCAVILGSTKALGFLKSHGVKAALLQCVDENGKPFVKKFGEYINKIGPTNAAA